MVSRAGAVRCTGIPNPALLRLLLRQRRLRASGPLLESYVKYWTEEYTKCTLVAVKGMCYTWHDTGEALGRPTPHPNKTIA